MNRYLVDLPIINATASPKDAFARLRETGRSGAIFFIKDAPYIVKSQDIVRAIVLGHEVISKAKRVGIGGTQILAMPTRRISIVGIDAGESMAQVRVGSSARMQFFAAPPLMCQCLGPNHHELWHNDHGNVCTKDQQPFDCSKTD